MATVLKANRRENLQGSTTRKLRKDGFLPGVLYGSKIDSQPVSVESVEFLKTVRAVGKNGIFSLDVKGGKTHQVMLYELQTDPLKDEFVHADFFEVDMTSEIEAEVSVHLVGDSPGANEGGVVAHMMYTVVVNCLPSDIPESIEVDISELHIGDSIQIADIRKQVSVDISNEDEETIVTVQAPAAEVEPNEPVEVDEDAEPEVINEKSEEE
ncbi:50S ribosomal protein L25/general stress protein Ctc [Alkalihalobacillus pseudalcaliphilus]|uniref:50S ribosomal protein L25/general stress protein Ctc n=1 Tax=Alkalihalobacillus pseudalcaliphilus TaxID=79884 RepID=UPI00064D8DC4|nr:50S ribosomal protein L25/general stress protein Ctc [Alkalihalobacillus pseudalcaliphilus]KMK74487.1 50S ribosomal protein L25 [Alkalihalobacillus pseudalcaliphilus]